MDKNAIKKYAVWARKELISRVSQKAEWYGITENDTGDMYADRVNGRVLSDGEKKQRTALISRIRNAGYRQVMEEAAYTWFNRLAALRYMEVNGYLPSHLRVFTDDANEFKPQILTEAIHLDIDGLDMEKVYALKEANDDAELFKYLIITQCNALGAILPGLFTSIEGWAELLFPDNLLREGSVIQQMIELIPEDNWTDQVQIIGWLYQYYNAEPKDKVFADLKKNIKISKENIPAATQLFTPDWIVRYMVENSLGRIWVEGHPNDKLKANWKYYLEEAEQEPQVQKQLAAIREEYALLKPEDLKVIDPCMGSGHILVYMFDVLVQIYVSYGYTEREAASLILENNLYGLDIDDRAAQLAYFAVMMKARQYDRHIFSRGIRPHVYAIPESNHIETVLMTLTPDMKRLLDLFRDAKEYGSILDIPQMDYAAMRTALTEDSSESGKTFARIIDAAEAMSQKYHAVVTNPPYMGGSGMSAKLSDFVKNNYPDSKSDLFAVFMERCGEMTAPNGNTGMITQHAWMFLSSFEKLRGKLMRRDTVNMAHLGARAFEEIGGEVVQTTSFVLRKNSITGYKGTNCRLIEPTTQQGKEDMFLAGENRYTARQDNFAKIPGAPVAYSISASLLNAFNQAPKVNDLGEPKVGLQSGNSEKYFRYWYEIDFRRISFDHDIKAKWFPCIKGGDARKWYGNHNSIINWKDNGAEIKAESSSVIRNPAFYFHQGITWTKITSTFAVRYFPQNMMLTDSSVYIFAENGLKTILSCLNSKVMPTIVGLLNPTLNFVASTIGAIPILTPKSDTECFVDKNIELSKTDWDSFETSWDFKRHPLVAIIPEGGAFFEIGNIDLAECYMLWEAKCNERFNQLKANEEELNRIFIDLYGLQDELTPEVDDRDVTVRKADLGRDIRSLISYAVGCMFGRYSLNVEGLAYAGGDWDDTKYSTFLPDKDGILPITDDEYFTDDIVSRFVKWVEVVYGKTALEDNLRFIASALGGKGSPREVIRNYFLNDFYADHLKIYQKRPIYWLFDSGKKNGFKALVYMHRWKPDTVARVRTDYVHEQQSRYRTAIADLTNRVNSASTSERVKLTKQLAALQAQADELHAYEEKVHHLADMMIGIDLDDGVKANYAKFEDVLARIK